MTRLVWGIGIVLGLVLVLVLFVRFQEARGIFFPGSYPEALLEELPDGIELVEFTTDDGVRLTGLLQRGEAGKPAVLMAHGNAGHMLDRLGWFERVPPDGWSGMVFDYRGYGRSEGTPSERGIYRDARAAAKFLQSELDGVDLYYHGRSLGVPVVADLAVDHPPRGMILESGFPDAASVAREILPVPGLRWLLSVDLDTLRNVQEASDRGIRPPILVVHGTEDRVIPIELGRRLLEGLPGDPEAWFVRGAGHNDLPAVAGYRYRQRLQTFLLELEQASSEPEGSLKESTSDG